VGIGASAGGLEALEQLFSYLPEGSGLAFVVVQHLAPEHVSLLAQLLGRRTKMPVVEAQDGMRAQADHVYVIAPGTTLGISGGSFHVTSGGERGGERRGLIDVFLRTLAADEGERAIGIVLSGSGSDGTSGLQAVQAHGGLTLAQDPETAKYDAMPRAAIAAGAVHQVMPAEQMPARLMERARDLAEGRGRLSTPAQAAVLPRAETPSDEQLAAALDRICPILERKTGHDFSHYKRGTVLRRLRQRLQLRRAASVDEYLDFLGKDAQEPELLAKDLLIGVTSFFRDPTAFEYLGQHVLPQILAAGREHEGVRIWVPGCASGEEAYSLGIQVQEQLSQLGSAPPVRIFATDIDSEAIVEARHARYPSDIAQHVSPERIDRFFTREGSSFVVGKGVREMCVFSEHSLIRDPPFANVDLISCRNVLIYLDAVLQKKLVSLFHYALRRGGFLFLGSAEGLAGHPDLFDAVHKRFRVFKRRQAEIASVVDLPAVGRAVPHARPAGRSAPTALRTREQSVNDAFERLMLQEYAPAGAVANAQGDLICVAGQTGRYLQPPAGILTTNILDIAHAGLRIELRTALHAAVRSRAEVVRDDVQVKVDGVPRRLKLTVRPLPGIKEEQLFAIILDERPGWGGRRHAGAPAPHGDARESAVQQLESELRTTRAELQTTVEELEGANEELKASNEELLSTNEEMQSTNEELRSSQEELSSLNEELITVNSELTRKVDELGQANSDLGNFFASTDVATVFVDRAQRIQRYTPAASQIFRLIAGDVGRPLADLAHRFTDQDLAASVSDVLRTLQPFEQQVETIDRQSWYLLRIVPYRTVENVIAGAVVTLADITRIKRFEAELRRAEEFSARVLETLPEPLVVLTPDLKVRFASAAFYRHFKVQEEETQGRRIYDLGNGQWDIPALRELLEEILPGNTFFDGYRVDHYFESIGRRIMLVNARRLEHRELILLVINDVTERLHAEDALRRSEERLAEAQRVGRLGSWEWDLKAGEVRWSGELYAIYGLAPESFIPTPSSTGELIHPDDRDLRQAKIDEVVSTGTSVEYDVRIVAADGSTRVLRSKVAISALDENGRPRVLTGVNQDVTERKLTEEALQEAHAQLQEADRRKNEFMAMLSHELRNPLAPIRNSLFILDRATPGSEQARRAQAVIDRQVAQMAQLIEGLLDVTRIARGKVQLQREVLDLNALAMRTVEDHRGAFVESGVELEMIAATAEVWVNGDPTRLSQSIGNLLQNAAKFTPRGGKTTASVEVDPARQQAIVRVHDTGRGIAPVVQSHLFEPFTQADVMIDRKKGGLGLGLALVKGLVEMHGGSVTAVSAGADQGATFTIALPLEGSEPVAAPRLTIETGRTVRRVLVIEDNTDAANSLREALQLGGHEVEVAYDGSEGLEKARSYRPDVVICDIGLPAMDGYAIARAVRADPQLARVMLVALTGYAGPDDVAQAREAGFDAHLAKPPTMDAVERVLQGRP
jgi:two-component system CheB/CheR fusion protein